MALRLVLPSVLRFVLPTVLLAVLLSGCGALTTIDGSWANPEFTQSPMSKVAVFAVGAKNFIGKATIEGAVVKHLEGRGMAATASSTIFPPSEYDKNNDGQIDDPNFKESAGRKLKELGFDGVFVVAIKDVKQEERYVPGTVSYQPYSGYYNNGWYGYWSTSYERVETPGYMATDVTAFAEANLYQLEKNALAWAAQTETFNPTSLQDAAESFADAIVPAMAKAGVIR